MREFVDQYHIWMSVQHCVDVEFVESPPAMRNAPGRHVLQRGEHGFGFGAVVRLDEPDDDVNTLSGKTIGLGDSSAPRCTALEHLLVFAAGSLVRVELDTDLVGAGDGHRPAQMRLVHGAVFDI